MEEASAQEAPRGPARDSPQLPCLILDLLIPGLSIPPPSSPAELHPSSPMAWLPWSLAGSLTTLRLSRCEDTERTAGHQVQDGGRASRQGTGPEPEAAGLGFYFHTKDQRNQNKPIIFKETRLADRPREESRSATLSSRTGSQNTRSRASCPRVSSGWQNLRETHSHRARVNILRVARP